MWRDPNQMSGHLKISVAETPHMLLRLKTHAISSRFDIPGTLKTSGVIS